MNYWIIYNLDSGMILRQLEIIHDIVPYYHFETEGLLHVILPLDINSYYVDKYGEIVRFSDEELQEKSAFRIGYQWCPKQRRQVKVFTDNEIYEKLVFDARLKRDSLLAVVDKMNPMWWETLSEAQKQSWIEYRQALLDVPQQSEFPDAIEWPEELV